MLEEERVKMEELVLIALAAVSALFELGSLTTLLFEVLFTFPSRYWSTIGLSGVFSLTGWSRQIHAEFLVFRATQDTAMLRLA